MSTEEWRPVPGWPGYSVSDHGRVMSTRRRFPRILKATLRNNYLRVGLYCGSNESHTSFSVHCLVLEAFVGPRPEGQHVRHLDGDNLNNCLSNLTYGTQSENERDKVRLGSHPEARKTHCPSGHPYSPENTYRRPDGWRRCRACDRDRLARRYAAQVAARREAA